jgi:hypothetical protein
MMNADFADWVASASRDRELSFEGFLHPIPRSIAEKDCSGATPKVRAGLASARVTRALPR